MLSVLEFVTMFMDNTYPFKKPDVCKTKINETYKMVRIPADQEAIPKDPEKT